MSQQRGRLAGPRAGARAGQGAGQGAWVVPSAITLALMCAAPTPGDIGGCGQAPEDLDARAFYDALETADCAACTSCGFGTATCERACGGETMPSGFEEGCAPLVHDGEVCLRRVEASSCDELRPSLADDAKGGAVSLVARPRPTECQFCPARP